VECSKRYTNDLVTLDKVMKRAVFRLVGAEETIAAVAGVDQVVLALGVSPVRQCVAPDTITQTYQIGARRLRRQQVFRILPRHEAWIEYKQIMMTMMMLTIIIIMKS